MDLRAIEIPTKADWQGGPWEIETPYAYRIFFGLGFEAAAVLYGDDPLGRGEDIVWMPTRCFKYYILACTHCILSARSFDEIAASYFLSMIGSRTEDVLACREEVMKQIIHALEKLKQQKVGCLNDEPDTVNEGAAAWLELILTRGVTGT